MGRKQKTYKKEFAKDIIYNSEIVNKLINGIMKAGKKTLAQKIVYGSFELIKTTTKQDPMIVFEQALTNITPQLEVRSRRVGGANYQIPVEVSKSRKQTLALRWIIKYARLRNEYTMIKKLTNEIIDASKNLGASIKKKQDIHKMAKANRAFAHFRW